MRKLYFLSIACLLSVGVMANDNEDYIRGQVVKSDGSRESTLVKVPLQADESSVLVKDESTGEDRSIKSDDIRSITVVQGGKTVQYIHTQFKSSADRTSGKSVWLRTVSWGEITLLVGEWNKVTQYFIRTEKESMPIQINKQNFKSTLIPLISDHIYLTKDLEKGNYEFNQLASVLDEYNAWKSFE